MMVLFHGGKYFNGSELISADILVANGKIEFVGSVDPDIFSRWPGPNEVIDCQNHLLLPGLVDSHVHLSGGSGEGGGFFSQSPQVLVSEFIHSGITTMVGTLGVDTTTKTMTDLLAKVKAYNEIGLTAFAYTGGYDTPPRTLTDSVRNDVMMIQEIIGVGEIAIADRRAPEPDLKDLARSCIDAYVGGMLSGKSGISHFHVGEGERRLRTIRDLLETQVIQTEQIHMTHIERSEALVSEAAALARKGCYVDFDIHERDAHHWIKIYKAHDGPLSQLTISSDAGVSSPREIWQDLRSCVLEHDYCLEEVLPHFTENTARALRLHNKGRIARGKDADIAIVDDKDLQMAHVMAHGKFFFKNRKMIFEKRVNLERRGFDIYEIHAPSS